MSDKEVVVSPEKEGWLKKRGARMHRWSNRYFALCGSTLVYKLKKESTSVRRTYDLMAGCILTEVEDDAKGGAKKGKQLYSFWIVWPQSEEDKKNPKDDEYLSDDDDERDPSKEHHAAKPKDLKEIVRSEVITNRTKQIKAEQELEKHHNVDNNLSMGMKVAAVAVGGVVIGTLTLGIGLIPYMTVVGITAVASGAGVAYQYRRPSDARLILATESYSEALAWKAAIEDQIVKLEATKCPRLPIAADPSVIASILGISTTGGGWFKVGQNEGIRIMQQGSPLGYGTSSATPITLSNGSLMRADTLLAPLFSSFSSFSSGPEGGDVGSKLYNGVVCRKSQTVIAASPVNVFLALMNTADGAYFWPRNEGSSLKVVHTADDHADTLGVSVPLDRSGEMCRLSLYDRLFGAVLEDVRVEGCLSRFWKLDDDGSYVIFFNSTCGGEQYVAEGVSTPYRSLPLKMDAVVSVAPRKDLVNQEHVCQMDVDVNECQVTISIQLQLDDGGAGPDAESMPSPWQSVTECTRNQFMNSFVEQILDLREAFYLNRFDFDFDNELNGQQGMSDEGNKGVSRGGGKVGAGTSARGGHAITSQPTGGGSGGGGGRATSPTQYSSIPPPPARGGTGGGLESRSSPSAISTGSSNARSQKVTNEAALLRNHIASKEYELARLHKVMSKRKDSSGLIVTVGSGSGRPTSPLVTGHKRAASPSHSPPSSSLQLPAVPQQQQHRIISSKPSTVAMARSESTTSSIVAEKNKINSAPTSSASASTTPSSALSSSSSTASSLSSNVSSSSKQEQELLQQQSNRSHELIDELNVLKGRYFRLTDMDYDKQQKRRLISNRRSSKTSSAGVGRDDMASVVSTAPTAELPSKPLIPAHIPMTPAAKSLRSIPHPPPTSSLKSLAYNNSSSRDNDSNTAPLVNGNNTNTTANSKSSQSNNNDGMTNDLSNQKLNYETSLMDPRHPPYWTLISSERKQKECLRCLSMLQRPEREVILYVLFFTVALMASALYAYY